MDRNHWRAFLWPSCLETPDLIARVSNLKAHHFLNDSKKNIFGRYKELVRTIEYHKRGLPHMHFLLLLDPESNFHDAEKVGEIICSEIPDKTKELELFEIVTSYMSHGPCDDINSGRGRMICSKRFLKEFQDETSLPEDGYPLYRRRRIPAEEQNNFFYSVRPLRGIGPDFVIDNRWVAPYTPFPAKKYKVHINVEVSTGVEAVKCINKYVYKDSDRTTLEIKDTEDEIKKYLHLKYIVPTEAVWNIFQFKTHEEDPTVSSLQVHLPGEQAVCFPSGASAAEIADILDNSGPALIAFFNYSMNNTDGG